MQVMQRQTQLLQQAQQQNRCTLADSVPRLQALRLLSNDLDLAFPGLKDSAQFQQHASQLRGNLNTALASPPATAKALAQWSKPRRRTAAPAIRISAEPHYPQQPGSTRTVGALFTFESGEDSSTLLHDAVPPNPPAFTARRRPMKIQLIAASAIATPRAGWLCHLARLQRRWLQQRLQQRRLRQQWRLQQGRCADCGTSPASTRAPRPHRAQRDRRDSRRHRRRRGRPRNRTTPVAAVATRTSRAAGAVGGALAGKL